MAGIISDPISLHGSACLLLFARLAPVLLLCPLTGALAIPLRLRLAFTLLLTLAFAPRAQNSAQIPSQTFDLLLAGCGEALLGLLCGCMILLMFLSLQLAGQLFEQISGFRFVSPPTDSVDLQGSPINSLMTWIAICIFLTTGAHRWIISGCVLSIDSYPLGTVEFSGSWLVELQQMIQHTLQVGISISLPLLTLLTLIHISIACVARSIPQFSYLQVGTSLNALAFLGGLFLLVGSMSWVYQAQLTIWIDTVQRVLLIET